MQSYNPKAARHPGLGSSRFARHYSGNHDCFLFLSLLRCFSSGGWLSFECCIFNAAGCPIRKSSDITLVCSSPKLIAAYHVLHRLSDPRHPPYALSNFQIINYLFFLLTTNMSKNFFLFRIRFASDRECCGGERSRTDDPLLAKQVL